MPRNPEIKKVMVIGSGPIIIGQAAEFDYAGTQACQSLREEGCEAVCFAGVVDRPDFSTIKPDLRGLAVIPGLVNAAVLATGSGSAG